MADGKFTSLDDADFQKKPQAKPSAVAPLEKDDKGKEKKKLR